MLPSSFQTISVFSLPSSSKPRSSLHFSPPPLPSGRFAVIRPHTFLYYYEDNSPASQPVGIIDLESYDTVQRLTSNVLTLTSASASSASASTPASDLRTFYFQTSSSKKASSWADALLMRPESLQDELTTCREIMALNTTQLNHCSQLIRDAEIHAGEEVERTYQVRCGHENSRSVILAKINQCLGLFSGTAETPLPEQEPLALLSFLFSRITALRSELVLAKKATTRVTLESAEKERLANLDIFELEETYATVLKAQAAKQQELSNEKVLVVEAVAELETRIAEQSTSHSSLAVEFEVSASVDGRRGEIGPRVGLGTARSPERKGTS